MYIVIPHMKTDGDSDSLDEIVSAIDVDALSDSEISESAEDGTMSDVVYVMNNVIDKVVSELATGAAAVRNEKKTRITRKRKTECDKLFDSLSVKEQMVPPSRKRNEKF